MLFGGVWPHAMESVMPLAMVAHALSVAVRKACCSVGPDAIRQLFRPWYSTQTSTRKRFSPRLIQARRATNASAPTTPATTFGFTRPLPPRNNCPWPGTFGSDPQPADRDSYFSDPQAPDEPCHEGNLPQYRSRSARH